MSDTLSRIKLQLRPVNGSVLNGATNGNGEDKTPTSPATKLLINHGKPNYTIQRSPKSPQNGCTSPVNNEIQNNNRNNYNPYKSAEKVKGTSGIVVTNGYNSLKKTPTSSNNNNNYGGCGSSNSSQNGDDLVIQSTKFNGVFKTASLQQQLDNKDEMENQVVLRRVQKPAQPPAASTQNGISDENVPEFILRQRRIQERLAKENVLDFENRRSGYFTHMVISPTSPNRTSLVETMSSPPIVPSLEIPPPTQQAKEASIQEETNGEVSAATNGVEKESPVAEVVNGHVEDEEEVAKAIEEVNKAVAGEADDEKVDAVEEEEKHAAREEKVEIKEEENVIIEHKVEEAKVEEHKVEEQEVPHPNQDEHKVEEHKKEEHTEVEEHIVELSKVEQPQVEQPQTPVVSVVVTNAPLVDDDVPQETQTAVAEPVDEAAAEPVHKEETTVISITTPAHSEVTASTPEPVAVAEEPKENGHAVEALEEAPKPNGHSVEEVTISHTNGLANGVSSELLTPSLPKPDPSGALGVNYEPKTVVSFSKDLGAPNKYPDTVKVVKTNEEAADEQRESDELKELAKLKFDIKAEEGDVQVTSVFRTD